MTLSGYLIIALAISVGFNFAFHAQKKAAERTAAVAVRDKESAVRIAEAHRAARDSCSLEMKRIRTVTDKELAKLEIEADAAEKSAEEYRRRLENPLPEDCDAIMKANVCPALFPY